MRFYFLPKNKFLNENYLFVSSLRAGSIYLLQINERFSKFFNEDRIFLAIKELEIWNTMKI